MAEHDAEPAGREEEREPDEAATAATDGPAGKSGADPGVRPVDEDAAWAAIVAGYGAEPPDPPGAKPFKSIEDLTLLEGERNDAGAERPKKSLKKDPPETGTGAEQDDAETSGTLGSSVVFAPGVGGPRNYSLQEPGEDDIDESEDGEEGHFVPPEPPPLPPADTTARFAWLAVIGGPLLLLVAMLLQWNMTWWLTTLGVGGFLGGFATLVARMAQDDEDDDDPGRGAVV